MKLSIFNDGDNLLLLGEGNFSFSRSLFNHQLPIRFTATCFDNGERYKYQSENINFLIRNNIPVFLDVDATVIHKHPQLKDNRYSKVIFNFPHVGGKMKVQLNRDLIKKVCESSSLVLNNDGLLILTLCNGQGGTPADNPQRRWDDSWQVIEMAAHGNFYLSSVEPFVFDNFPSYQCTGYRSQDSSFNFHGALVHIFRKKMVLSRLVDDSTALQRLNYVPLSERSTILVPYYYFFLYSKNPLNNPKSCVSFFKEQVLKFKYETDVKWKILSDDEIPISLNTTIGMLCKINSNGNSRLRSSAFQVLEIIMKKFKLSNVINGEIIFFPGMYFNFQLGSDFNRVPPISFEYVLLGKSVSAYFSSFMKGLVNMFNCDNVTVYTNVMFIPTSSGNNKEWDSCSLFKHTSQYFNINCRKVIEWCCKFNNNDDQYVVAHEVHLDEEETGTVEGFIIYVDKLIEVFFGVNSWKEVWSEGSTVSVLDVASTPILHRSVMYPSSYKFDITLKYDTDEGLKNDSVYEILRICAIDLIVSVEMINEYASDMGWSSKCFRITYQSLDEPLHRQLVIDIQTNLIRKMLSLALPVTIK